MTSPHGPSVAHESGRLTAEEVCELVAVAAVDFLPILSHASGKSVPLLLTQIEDGQLSRFDTIALLARELSIMHLASEHPNIPPRSDGFTWSAAERQIIEAYGRECAARSVMRYASAKAAPSRWSLRG